MPPTALTHYPMSLRCLTLGGGRGGVIAGMSGGGKIIPFILRNEAFDPGNA